MNQRPLDLQSNALSNYAITAYKYNILLSFILIILKFVTTLGSYQGNIVRQENRRNKKFVWPPVGGEELDQNLSEFSAETAT